MKKIVAALLLAGIITACGNEKASESIESAPVTPGVENVNGNIPDTNESIRLNQPLPGDSSRNGDTTH